MQQTKLDIYSLYILLDKITHFHAGIQLKINDIGTLRSVTALADEGSEI